MPACSSPARCCRPPPGDRPIARCPAGGLAAGGAVRRTALQRPARDSLHVYAPGLRADDPVRPLRRRAGAHRQGACRGGPVTPVVAAAGGAGSCRSAVDAARSVRQGRKGADGQAVHGQGRRGAPPVGGGCQVPAAPRGALHAVPSGGVRPAGLPHGGDRDGRRRPTGRARPSPGAQRGVTRPADPRGRPRRTRAVRRAPQGWRAGAGARRPARRCGGRSPVPPGPAARR
jgi:hypothetical protein